MAVKKSMKKTSPKKVFVDFPQEGELIRAGFYAIRVGAPDAHAVEITFDGKTWKSSRHASGYFWLDWRPLKSGPVRIIARARSAKGRVSRSLERRCLVTR